MRVLYLANIPSPYRVDFFNELGKKCELTVLFETQNSKERDEKWIADAAENYTAIFLKGIRVGVAEAICPQVIKFLSSKKYDVIVVGMYSSPTGMLAIEYMRIRKISFILNSDGGMIKEDKGIKYKIKRRFIGSASAWLSTGNMTTDYFCHYGAKKEQIYKYPFTSIWYKDIIKAKSYNRHDREALKKKLGIEEGKIILTVGRFTYEGGYGKGYDTLLRAAEMIPQNVGIYIIGDEPTEEFIQWKEQKKLKHVHYLGFKRKNELAEYYASADLFVLLTKYDVWGLVINESMIYSLPEISTEACGAGRELIQNDENGYIIPVGDVKQFLEKASYILQNESVQERFGKNSFKKVQEYTIENMAEVHMKIFNIITNQNTN